MRPLSITRRFIKKALVIPLISMFAVFLLSACGGNTQMQQQASQSKSTLDSTLAHAQNIGVPRNVLQPVLQQENQLDATHAPIGLFGDQSVNDYYSNLTQRYSLLNVQVNGLEVQSTQQLDYLASQDLQNLENALAERQAQNFVEAKTFANQLTTDQQLLAKAQYPKDYIQISLSAKRSIQALHLMGPAYNALTSLQQIIKQLQASHVDTTALKLQAQSDLLLFRQASSPEEYSSLIDLTNTQLEETTTLSTQAIPYVGAAKLKQLSSDITLLQQYGVATTIYQQHLQKDQQALTNAKSIGDYLKVSQQIDSDIAAIQFPLTQGQASFLLKQFHQEVTRWGSSHQYHDTYNGASYSLDYEYDMQGIGSDADGAVQSAQTLDDYQTAIDLINNDMLHLKMMEQDYTDKTPWNQPHATDLQLMNHYGISKAGEVLVVSLIEQTLRYYQNGKLVKAFYITSGQFDKPSPPGYWQVFLRESPTKFKSSEPKGSPFWYPDTKINFAMEYHSGGYFFHDSWWRVNYGPGTNFPHYDVGGDEEFAGSGSHGCINMQEDQAGWLYNNTAYNANVLLY